MVFIVFDVLFVVLCILCVFVLKFDVLGWVWGLIGGVGFVFVSGLLVLYVDSDFDFVLCMLYVLLVVQCDQFVYVLIEIECCVDLQIDIGCGGFVWCDWLNLFCQVLFKIDYGLYLVVDLWSDFV